MMSPGMWATTRRSLDWAESACRGPVQTDRTSSRQSIILVVWGRNVEADLGFVSKESSQKNANRRNFSPGHGGSLEILSFRVLSLREMLRFYHQCSCSDFDSSGAFYAENLLKCKLDPTGWCGFRISKTQVDVHKNIFKSSCKKRKKNTQLVYGQFISISRFFRLLSTTGWAFLFCFVFPALCTSSKHNISRKKSQ